MNYITENNIQTITKSHYKKAIMLIADGLGDRPIELLNGKTPAEFAQTPTLDFLCTEGSCGLVHPYKAGCCCGTDWGHLSLFGYDPKDFYTGRGSLEAISAGIKLETGDIAFRGNFATVTDDLIVLDRRAGRISDASEISQLLAAIAELEIDGCQFITKPLTEHRLAIVMRGSNLSSNIKATDPGTAKEGESVVNPSLNCNSTEYQTAALLWKFLLKVKEIWDKHPVNQKRKINGLLPANIILTRGCGAAMIVPPFQQSFPNCKVACIAGDDIILGIGKMCNFDSYTKPSFSGGFETDYQGKATLALELLANYDLVIVHIKGPDLCGHDNLPLKKIKILEQIDKMFAYWLTNINQENTYLSIIADHSTPCNYREHSADPVPCFLSGPFVRVDDVNRFGERYMSKGLLNNYTGTAFMKTVMDFMGFSQKYGD